MRVLVDGVDLTGKTTLVRSLVAELQARGFAADRNVGPLRKGALARAAQARYRAACDPGDATQTWLFVAAALADLAAPRCHPGILVQEAWVEHTIALARALGRPVAAAVVLAIEALLPRFDAAILLVADETTRRRRLAARAEADALDRLLVEAPEASAELERTLNGLLLRRPNVLVLDSARLAPEEMVRRAVEHVLAAREVADAA